MGKPDGGRAFPKVLQNADADSLGITARDYFATRAMQAILQQTTTADARAAANIAAFAYLIADAMVAERAKA